MELTGRQFGHIRVTEVVGQGGMGDVYAGYDEKLERKVALKVLNNEQRLDDEARERLLREARALSKLDHPNICRIHDYIESADVDLLVLEYIDGRTMSDALLERKMPRGEKLRIAIAVAEVLVTAHRAGIVHRDLKPENVMLTRNGEVKVLDFGLARWLNRSRARASEKHAAVRVPMRLASQGYGETMILPSQASTATTPRREFATAVGITMGTPLYMSPEQARGESLTPASDMFSFGLLLQALFTGEDPHPLGLSAREVILRVARGETLPVHGAPGDVTALIQRLKQFAPADRPTAIETVERLRFLADKPERIARRSLVAALALIAVLGGWRYTVDLKAERAIAVAARAEAERRRAQAEDLIEFMLGDLRKKLEPVGRLDVMDDVADRALAYSGTAKPETLSTPELVQNAKALHQLVQVRIKQGRLDQAVESANRALVLTQVAARRDPSSVDVQVAVGLSHFWLGDVRRLRGEYPEALAALSKYRDVTVRVAEAHPRNDDYQLERAYGHGAVATIYEAQGEYRGAVREYERTVAVNRARLAADPTDKAKQAELAWSFNKIGRALQRLGRLAEARTNFESEHAIYQRLVDSDPRQRRWQDRLANSHDSVAGLLEIMGEADAAMVHRQAEVDIYRRLYEHDPQNANWKRNYSLVTMRLGDLLRRKSQTAEALPLFARSEQLLREVSAADPTRPSWQRDLAVVQFTHARALAAAGRLADAERLATRAEVSLLQLPVDDPINRRSLAECQLIVGEIADARGANAEAAAAWGRALATIQDVAANATDPVMLDTWIRALLRTGRSGEAAPVVARLRASGYRHDDLDALLARTRQGRA